MVDLDRVREAGIRIGADPLGGASVAYWGEIAERHGIRLESQIAPGVEQFDGDELTRTRWLPHYLPHWSSRPASAARARVRAGSADRRIDHG